MATKLEEEEFLYRRAIEIIESADSDTEKKIYYSRKYGRPWRHCM